MLLRFKGMELTVLTLEIFEKHTFIHNYVAKATVNTSNKFIDYLKGFQCTPFTVFNESH